jgi:hypothetical protein
MFLFINKNREMYVDKDTPNKHHASSYPPPTPVAKSSRQYEYSQWYYEYNDIISEISNEFVHQLDEHCVPEHYVTFFKKAIEEELPQILYKNSSTRWKNRRHVFFT